MALIIYMLMKLPSLAQPQALWEVLDISYKVWLMKSYHSYPSGHGHSQSYCKNYFNYHWHYGMTTKQLQPYNNTMYNPDNIFPFRLKDFKEKQEATLMPSVIIDCIQVSWS